MNELEDKDFKKMWERLLEEFKTLNNGDVESIHPQIVLDYMVFIRQIAIYNKHLATLEAKLKIAGVS